MKSKYSYLEHKNCLVYAPTYKGIRKYFYGKTDAEIDRKVKAWKESLDNGTYNIRTFEEVANHYWEQKQNDISPTTFNGYLKAVNRAIEAFRDMYVNEITPQQIYAFLERFKAQGYSSKTINNTKCILKGIFDDAFVAQEIQTNPCISIPPIKGKSKNPRMPATDDDIVKIEQHKTDSLIGRMYYFMLYTGARRGEAAAIQVKDIDYDAKSVRITKTLVYGYSSEGQIKSCPKTEAGVRTIQLPDNVMEILPTYKNKETYIFFPNGFPTRKLFEKGFDSFRKSCNIEATPHQLRHSYASMLHSAHIDVKDAQHLLGHANISVTQDIYTHLDREHTEEVRNQLNDYIKSKIK